MIQPYISIVIPVYNSAGTLQQLHSRICSSLNGQNYQLILVNDDSRDRSWETISQICSSDNKVLAVNLRKNAGQDNAILAGLRFVKGRFVVIMDDDLQHAPEDIPALVKRCEEGFDVCYASFYRKRQSWVKRLGSRVNGMLACWVLKKPLGIYLSPFKAMKAEIAAEIAAYSGPYPYIDGIILETTSYFGQVTVEHHQRVSGKSNYTMSRSASVLFKLFTGFSVAPLRLAALTGMGIALVGLGLIFYYLYDYFIVRDFVEGWTTLVVLIIFFGGLNLMMLGLLGEYIGRIFLTLSNKQQYTIREIINPSEE